MSHMIVDHVAHKSGSHLSDFDPVTIRAASYRAPRRAQPGALAESEGLEDRRLARTFSAIRRSRF